MSALDATLSAGRAEAEARMREQVCLYRQGADIFDRTTGQTLPGPQTVFYTGKARVKGIAASTGEDKQAGEREVVLREYEVGLPWATALPPGARVLPGDRIEVVTSGDPRMVGLVLWVTGSVFSEQSTAWRIRTEDRS
ncbi:DUF6093 family protein [Streptomyces sp. NPDC056323]|uniref:DUF6093 family protein n=1 Tax=Streptomyces sp. NPDC056323 TaxID=3345784 RepID=UPI0035DDEB8F